MRLRITLGVSFVVALAFVGLSGEAEASLCNEICTPTASCDQTCWVPGGPPSTCGTEGYQCGCPQWVTQLLNYSHIDVGSCPNPNKPPHFVKTAHEYHYRYFDNCGIYSSYRACVFDQGSCLPSTNYGPQFCPFCGFDQQCAPY